MLFLFFVSTRLILLGPSSLALGDNHGVMTVQCGKACSETRRPCCTWKCSREQPKARGQPSRVTDDDDDDNDDVVESAMNVCYAWQTVSECVCVYMCVCLSLFSFCLSGVKPTNGNDHVCRALPCNLLIIFRMRVQPKARSYITISFFSTVRELKSLLNVWSESVRSWRPLAIASLAKRCRQQQQQRIILVRRRKSADRLSIRVFWTRDDTLQKLKTPKNDRFKRGEDIKLAAGHKTRKKKYYKQTQFPPLPPNKQKLDGKKAHTLFPYFLRLSATAI